MNILKKIIGWTLITTSFVFMSTIALLATVTFLYPDLLTIGWYDEITESVRDLLKNTEIIYAVIDFFIIFFIISLFLYFAGKKIINKDFSVHTYIIVFLIFVLIGTSLQSYIISKKYAGLTIPFNGEENESNIPNQYKDILDEYINNGSVGVQMAISTPENQWITSSGFADCDKTKKITNDDLFMIGSVTKVYTAVAILKLYEDGKIQLDDEISDFLPQNIIKNIANGDKITVRQLLNHTSGLKNYVYITYKGWEDGSIKYLSAEENIAYIYNLPADFEPGSAFNYSNSNYLLLGIILKNVTKEASAYDAINQIILQPFDLNHTFADSEKKVNVEGCKIKEDTNNAYNVSSIDFNAVGGVDMTDGGMISNAKDVLIFFNLLVKGEILKPETFNLMQTWVTPEYPNVENRTQYLGYGLGLTKIKTDNLTGIGHYGMVYSFNSLVYYFPEKETTIVILNNTHSPKIEGVHMGNNIYNKL